MFTWMNGSIIAALTPRRIELTDTFLTIISIDVLSKTLTTISQQCSKVHRYSFSWLTKSRQSNWCQIWKKSCSLHWIWLLINKWVRIYWKMFKILIVLKKLIFIAIFMDFFSDILYDSFTLLFCWNIPVWIKHSTHVSLFDIKEWTWF